MRRYLSRTNRMPCSKVCSHTNDFWRKSPTKIARMRCGSCVRTCMSSTDTWRTVARWFAVAPLGISKFHHFRHKAANVDTKTVRIGSGSAYWGDMIEPAVELAKSGEVDYISFDLLAELTMSVFQRVKMRDPQKGFVLD